VGRVLLLAAVALVVAGCGSKSSAPEPATTAGRTAPATTQPTTAETSTGAETVPAPAEPRSLDVYFLRNGKLAAAGRPLPASKAVATAALQALLAGPTSDERSAGLTTAVPAGLRVTRLEVRNGVAIADFQPTLSPITPEFAQIVWTLTQFPSIRRVSVALETQDSAEFGRADVEGFAAPIILDSPTAGETVTAPLRVRGTANTYEATVNYELRDGSGHVLKSGFFTATSGSGVRGTFDEVLQFDAPPGTRRVRLALFEISAASGKRTHEVDVPLVLAAS
jgi:hypothetical protein